jgi:hypothetical protein
MATQRMLRHQTLLLGLFLLLAPAALAAGAGNVDTGQSSCYGNTGVIPCPQPGQPFYGQDAQFVSNPPHYRDNGDGTVTDLVTGLMWSKGLSNHKVTPEEGARLAAKLTLGGHSDWRVPTVKELYTLIDFRGYTGFHGRNGFDSVPADAVPFIDTDYFDFAYGDTAYGERYIDAQWLSATQYVATTMDNMETVFGVNFADGRIKGYGYKKRGTRRVVKTFYVRYVRGPAYGINDFVDNGDGTVTDRSTGLMWTKADSGKGMNWQQTLAYAAHLKTGGYDDWRLPNAKELEDIVDYSRSPDTTGSAAIDPVFTTTAIVNEAGERDYPYFWTSTTHLDGPRPGADAVYIAFGRAIGEMRGRIMDVHGAGAQRSDPKTGSPRLGHGPQGDAQRILNDVRCVRGGAVAGRNAEVTDRNSYPNKIRLVKLAHDPNLVLGHEARKLRDVGNEERPFGPPPPRGRRGFVARLDRDGDGRVSRSEFDGPPDRFDILDTDHDGYLTEDEAPKGPPPGRGWRPGR